MEAIFLKTFQVEIFKSKWLWTLFQMEWFKHLILTESEA